MANINKKKSSWGGPRNGAGRKKQIPTSVLAIRVPTAFKSKNEAKIKARIRAEIESWKAKNKQL